MIRDLIRSTKLREAVADTIALVCLFVVLLAWLFIAAALEPVEGSGPAAHATVSESLVVLP